MAHALSLLSLPGLTELQASTSGLLLSCKLFELKAFSNLLKATTGYWTGSILLDRRGNEEDYAEPIAMQMQPRLAMLPLNHLPNKGNTSANPRLEVLIIRSKELDKILFLICTQVSIKPPLTQPSSARTHQGS